MVVTLGWIDTEHVLQELGIDVADERLGRCIDAAEATCCHWRQDITDWESVRYDHPNVYQGAVRLSALLWQQASTPEGFAGFDEGGGVITPEHSQLLSIRRLCRANRPKVG